MIFVGLTGGIASGKSLVTRVLHGLGAHIIDADRIVHELLAAGQEPCREIIDHFGPEVRLPDGSIDRRKLGEIVFNDAEKRRWLNECVHPRVFEAYQNQVRRLRERRPDAIVVLDAALLIETGYHKYMDKIIVVYARPEDQLERLLARNHFTREQAMTRISSQMPLDEKRKFADYVIENTGSREETERRAREVFEMIRHEAEKVVDR